MDSALPQIPGQPAAAPSFQNPAGQPQLQRPPGRPADDPLKQEERTARHAERKRVDAVLPKRATESKIQLFRKDSRTGRRAPGARPVLTVLVSELEKAQEENIDSDEYLQDALINKLGDRAEGVYEAQTVDRRGTRLDFPTFDVIVGEEPNPEDEDDPEGDDQGDLSLEEEEEMDRLDAMQRGNRSAPTFVAPPQGPPPPAPHVDIGVIDDFGRRNRDEAKNETASTMALIMQAMQSSQSAQLAAQAQQTQLMVAALQSQRPAESGNKDLIIALVTALAPMLNRMTEPKPPDPMLQALLVKMIDKDGTGGMQEMLKIVPSMIAQAAKQSSDLQAQASQSTALVQGELMKGMVTQTLQVMRESQRERLAPGEKEGGSTFENVARIAAAVLPQLMGKGQPPAEEPASAVLAQAPAALPAPRPTRPTPKAPPPVAAAPVAAPGAPVQPRTSRNDPQNRIRTCLNEIAKLQVGATAAEKRWDLAAWVMKNAPPPVIAEIRQQSFDGVIAVCSEAVIVAPKLLEWIAVPANQEFLKEFLDDARKLEGGAISEEYATQQVIKTRAQQKPRSPAPDPTPPKPAAAEIPTKPAEPAAAAPAAPAAPATPAASAEPPAAPSAQG
jgi:hypothetical protein